MRVTLGAISGNRAGAIGLAIVIATLFVSGAAYAVYRRPKRPGTPDIPPAMKPGPPDQVLEKSRLERMIAYGAVAVMFLALWVPIVWLHEPAANRADIQSELATSIQNGHDTTMLNSPTNPGGFGCVRCHGVGLGGGFNTFNGQRVTVPNLQTVCGGAAFGHAQIHGLSDIINTIAQGRAGTDMPSWSVRYAGSMDDQQINDIVNYLLTIQRLPASKNLCLPAK